MKNFIIKTSVLLLALLLIAHVVLAQQSLNGIRLQDATSHVLTISAPAGGFTANYNFRFPAALPAVGAIVYSSDALGQTSWLTAGSNGQVLTLSGGIPSWTTLSIAGDIIGTLAASTVNGTGAAGNHIITALNLGTNATLNADPLKHDATLTVASNQLGVATNGIGLGNIAQIGANTILGNNTAGTANATALTTSQVKTMLNLTGTNSGDVTLAGTGTYLSLSGQAITENPIDLSSANATGILAAGRFPALTGDVTSVAGALATTISNNAVTYAKMQNTTAASVLLGRNSVSAGAIGEITLGSGLVMSALGVLSAPGSGGTVTSISVVSANGVSGTVATPTTTPAITLTLGAITPTSVAATGAMTGSNLSGTNTGDMSLSGTGTYLSLAGQVLTQNPIDLSSANATGILAAARFPALTGDVTTVAGALGTTIGAGKVTYAKIQNETNNTILGNVSGLAASPAEVTAAQLKTLLNLTGTNSGDVALAGTGTYLSLAGQVLTQNPIDLSSANASGILAAARFPALTGDVTTVAGALGTTISANAVTYAKMQNTTAAGVLLGRNSVSAGAIGEITLGAGLAMSSLGVLSATGAGGTVTSVSVVNANGVSGVVATPTTTPAITLTLGAITPTSVAATGAVSGNNLSGTNTGDVTLAGTGTYLSRSGQVITQNPIDLSSANASGILAAARFPALTGDVTTVAGALGTTISANAVTYGKMQNTSAGSVLLGRNSTGLGAIGEITLGAGLAMSSLGVLSSTALGTVTSVSVVSANGVSGTVATPTTTPAITLTLGAITPTSVAATGAVSGSNLSGTNTGDMSLAGTGTYLSLAGQVLTQNPIDLSSANASGILAAARFPALTGDVTTVAGALGTTISANAVTYAKMQNTTAAGVLLGRNSVSAGAIGEITLGAGLAMSSLGVLYSTALGTVTSVSVVSANGVSGTVATPTTTPAITLTLGSITPTSVAATGTVSGSNLSGTNTGDVTLAGTGTYLSRSGQVITQNPIDLSSTNAAGILAAARFPALTGDVTTVAGSLATTISNNAVTYSDIQNTAAASVLLGRNSTGPGAVGEITLGTGLSMSSAGILSATGSWGTVTSVSVVNANGVSGVVATPTTTPAITLALGAITPTSVAATGAVSGNNLSGTNTGDVTLAGTGTYLSRSGQVITQNPIDLSSANASGILAAARFPALSGDVTTVAGSLVTTITNGAVQYADIQNETNNTLLGNVSGISAAPTEVTAAQLKTLLNLTGTNSGDITLGGTATYLSLTGQTLVRNAVDLSSSVNATGILAAGRFPALTGDITTVAGALGTTIGAGKVTYAKIQATSAAGKLIGSPSSGTAIGEITVGTGLNLSGSTLSTSATTGLFARETADVTFISNATLTADTNLVIALAANATYEFSGVIAYNGATSSSDLQIAMNVPTGATIRWSVDQAGTAFSSSSITGNGGTTAAVSPFSADATPANNQSIFISGIVITGATAGNLQVYEAQATSSATNTTTVLTNSHIKSIRVQ